MEVVPVVEHEAAKAEDVDGVLQDDGVDGISEDADVHHHPGVRVDHSIRRGQLHGAVHGDAVDLEVPGNKPAAVHEVILRAGVEAQLLDPMHVLLSGHAVHGVHGRKRHVDDLAVAVVLDVVVALKVDAASSRGDRGGGSSVRELAGVTELAVPLGVVLAGGLGPFSLQVLLALLPGLVESVPFGLRELRLGVVAVCALVAAGARALDEVVARRLRGIRGRGSDAGRALSRRRRILPFGVHAGHRSGGLDAVLRREELGVVLLVAILLDVAGEGAVEVLVGSLGRALLRHPVSGEGLSHLDR